MYLRESKQKRSDGSVITHFQIAESVWDSARKRSETKILCNVGRVEDALAIERLRKLARGILRRCAPEDLAEGGVGWKVVDSWPHGDVYVLDVLWRRLGIPEALAEVLGARKHEFSVERALFAMVANRCCAPASKLYCYEQWLREDVRLAGAADLALHHLYRAMDVLIDSKDAIEKGVFFRASSLLNLEVDLVFYDTTSLHFEVDAEDPSPVPPTEATPPTESSAPASGLRQRGNSKNGRYDAPQIVVGLAVTRDGLPVRHWVFPGNTVDVTTVRQVRDDLRGWQLSRTVFVGDAGMVSEANLAHLTKGGGRFILCVPMRRGDTVTTEVMTRPGRYRAVADRLRVKEVIVGEGERRRRYVVAHNPDEERRQRLHREQLLAELEAELATLQPDRGTTHSKRVCDLRTSERFGRYLRVGRGERLEIDRAKVRADAHFDGKFVVHSNDDSLSPEDMALAYKQLMRVEQCWRTLKSGLKMRPVYHRLEHRIRAHVALAVLGLLLERVAERACDDTWRNIRDHLRQIKLVQLKAPEGTLWQVTEPQPAAAKRLKSLGIDNPPPIASIG